VASPVAGVTGGPVRRRCLLGDSHFARNRRVRRRPRSKAADHNRAGVVSLQMADPATAGRAGQKAAAVVVAPVTGPSTLHHLGLSIDRSSMGWDGQMGAPPAHVPAQAPPPARAENPAGDFVLSSADVYRVSCRACHKPDGSGVPPQINSIIGPVQSASMEWTTARMRERGRPVDPKFIRQLTSLTEADLQKRLKVGGHNMPSFAHLSDEEIRVLRPYLDELASVPGAERQQRQITEPAVRVGELIVKGTCHICHDATGPDSRPTTGTGGVIGSLAAIRHEKTLAQFVQNVRAGAPPPVTTGSASSRARMPVFSYLSEAEAAAAFSYLTAYPPK
jgi:mono/diheme cytochrome c family protein